jgi:hypothetical protein
MEKKIEPEKASKNRQSKNMKLVYTAAGAFLLYSRLFFFSNKDFHEHVHASGNPDI